MKDSWREKKVSDFGNIITGSTPSTKISSYWDGQYPFYSPADFKGNVFCSETERGISEEGLKKGRILPINSVLFTCIGSIGKMAINDEIGISNQQINAVLVNEENDFKFIYYLLFHFKNRFKNFAPMTTIQIINKTEFGQFRFDIPPLPQQKKIAQILSKVDEVIEQTESAIAKYQTIKQGLMQDLFTRGIDVNTGQLRPSPQDAPELYKESALGLIPREWEVEELGKENETYAGGTPNRAIEDYYKGEIPWVASGEVNQSFIFITKESISSEALRYSSAKMAPKESVLIAMYGATAAQVSMLKIDACTNQAVLAIIPNSLWNNYFIYYGLNYSKDRILFLAQGSGQPNLNKKMIDTTQFWKPILAEQKLIVDRLNGIETKIQTEQKALAKYQQLKAGLMQDLLTGRVEVKVNKKEELEIK